MQTVSIQTSQNISIDYEIAGLGERVVARLIDYAIFIALFIVIAMLTAGNEVGVYIMIALSAAFVFYDLLCELLLNGQSFGKRVMKIRVISLDGSRPSFGQYLLRWLFRIVDFSPLTVYLGGLICAACTKNVQRIGDLVANTTLIKTEPRTRIDHLAFSPAEDSYQPVFAEAVQLNDKDIALVAEVINNYLQTGNTVVVYNTAERLKTLLNVTMPPKMNDLLFLQTIIKDYSHIITQEGVA